MKNPKILIFLAILGPFAPVFIILAFVFVYSMFLAREYYKQKMLRPRES